MTVFFHGNFGLNRSRMAKLARLASDGSSSSDADLAKEFGYGAPFAATYRSWLHKTGIAELRKPFRLTAEGRVILSNDPTLDSEATKWFMHHALTTDPERAESWHFLFHEFRPEHTSFTKEELMVSLMMKLRWHNEDHFGPNSSMNPIITRKLLECYISPGALGSLGLITERSNGNFVFQERVQIGPWASKEEFEEAIKKGG